MSKPLARSKKLSIIHFQLSIFFVKHGTELLFYSFIFYMKKKYITLLLFLVVVSFAFAQEKKCGAISPDFSEQSSVSETTQHQLQANEILLQEWISNPQNQINLREIITIPVVVHIVWKDESENISDLEIEAQIDGLTADFRKLNTNTNIIPESFRSLAVDTEIEFCLASIDPEGRETNGIIRRKTTITNIGTHFPNGKQAICYTDMGGSDGWNTDNYINIWVGQLQGSLLGRATMPGEVIDAEDGVFIDSDFFGFSCSLNNNFALGRTLTHEMGHFFNLFHVFGAANGCDTDDLVEDTPLQFDPHRGCPSYPQMSCGSEDMFMNFMDYTADDCVAMFTEGQKMRMLATLNLASLRHSLVDSPGCDLTKIPDLTLSADDVLLFPNPASDCVHIDLDLDNDLPIKMIIFNTIGQNIYASDIFVKDLRTFDLSPFSNGIYFIYFETKDQIASKKLIIDR